MKSFKEYLIESKRDKKQALKLWNYILARRSYKPRSDGELRDTENIIPLWKQEHEDEWNKIIKHNRFPEDYTQKWEKIPIHKIITNQPDLEANIVRQKIIGRKTLGYKESPGPELEHLPKYDVYLLSDGNHRIAKDKLKGKKFTTAWVSRPNE